MILLMRVGRSLISKFVRDLIVASVDDVIAENWERDDM